MMQWVSKCVTSFVYSKDRNDRGGRMCEALVQLQKRPVALD